MRLTHELMIATGLPLPDVLRIISTAPKRYKVYEIPKKHGGWRQIAHPARELKALQYVLLDRYLQKMPVHPAAMAYVKGRNIGDNAERHASGRVFLKLDFEAFFPSIRVIDWQKFLARLPEPIFSDHDALVAANILFWGAGSYRPKCLSIGAPTSPIISNILLYDLDVALTRHAKRMGVRYTRYADDITVSGNTIEIVQAFEQVVRREVSQLRSPKLKFNDKKRGIYGPGQRRMVTGLVVTPEGRVSIGRQRKRMISALLHRFTLNQLNIEQLGILKGMLGFTIANEPSYLDRMRTKYGNEVVNRVLKAHIPGRLEEPVNVDEILLGIE